MFSRFVKKSTGAFPMDELIKYVIKSTYRVRVLNAIGGDVKMPFQIAEESNILNNHISKTLRQLREHGLVELITNTGKIVLIKIKSDTL